MKKKQTISLLWRFLKGAKREACVKLIHQSRISMDNDTRSETSTIYTTADHDLILHEVHSSL